MGSSLELALLVLCVEFALVAAGILYFARRAGKAGEARVVDNVTSLVHSVERSERQRHEALLITMQDTYRMDPEEAERVVSDFIERERAFYNALIGVHLGRSGKSLADVPAELTKLIAPWLRITPRGQVDKSAVEALETSKAAIEVELSDTRKVLDELMAEYNAAFNNRAQEDKDGAAEPAREIPHDELLSLDAVAPPPAPPSPAPKSAPDLDDLLLGGDDEPVPEDDEAVDIEVAPRPVKPATETVIDLDTAEDAEDPEAPMSQDELDALLGDTPKAPSPAASPAPAAPAAPAPADDDAEPEVPMSQADLDALLENLDDDLFSGKPER